MFLLFVNSCNPSPPTCTSATLYIPQLQSPNNVFVSSLTPTFDWFYPWYNADQSDVCEPENYRIEVAPNNDFGGPGSFSETVAGDVNTWVPGTALQPSTWYVWRVIAIVGSDESNFMIRSFWTEPMCLFSELVSPILLSPIGGTTINTNLPNFQWDYPDPDCLPNEYYLEASHDANFSNIALALTSSPGPIPSFQPGTTNFQECTPIYWRVAPVVGGQQGSFSTTETFIIDSNNICSPIYQIDFRSIFCLSLSKMAVGFNFDHLNGGEFYATVQGIDYSCSPIQEVENVLLCTGPPAAANTYADIFLHDQASGEILFTTRTTVPRCVETNEKPEEKSCGAPEFCNSRLCYYWNAKSCKCVQNLDHPDCTLEP